MRRAIAFAAALSFTGPAAHAADPADAEPGLAYERGQTAFEQKDYVAAARYFARADELAPSHAALESGLKAALLADDAPLGMELAERADTRKVPPSITVLVERARKAFSSRAGRVTVRCPPPDTSCRVDLDGQVIAAGEPKWAPIGERTIIVTSGGAKRVEHIEVRAGTTVELVPGAIVSAPPAGSSATPSGDGTSIGTGSIGAVHSDVDTSSGVSPVFFVVTAIATGILTGVTIWSGVDTLGLHDDFQAGDLAARDDGKDAQLRTNVLIGLSAGGGAATIVLGFVTDFGGSQPVSTPATSRGRLHLLPSF